MAEANPSSPNGKPRPIGDDAFPVSAHLFEEQFDESIVRALDLGEWRLGNDLDQEYRRIEREVREAEQHETATTRQIRDNAFPRLAAMDNMPRHAGKHEALLEDLAAVQRGLLFNGGVEACDGAIQIHETLPLTIYQIGVSLVSYRGNQGTWGQRLFRRDLRQKGVQVEEWIEFLERRAQRDVSARMPGEDQVGELVQKALLQYAERAILLRHSRASWRLGHGQPVTYELLTGGGNVEIMVAATKVLRELVEVQQKFVFVAGEPQERLFRTIGQALRPMEYAIVGTLDDRLDKWLHQQRFTSGSPRLMWDDEPVTPGDWIPRVIREVASKIVIGLFRPTLLAPAQVFYAHVAHSEIAAHIALADSMLKEQGSSLLLEMAHRVCVTEFGENLAALAESAYANAGAQGRFVNGKFHGSR